MLKDDQTYFKDLVLSTTQDFFSVFGHLSASSMKGLYDVGILEIYITQPASAFSKLTIKALEQGVKYVQI